MGNAVRDLGDLAGELTGFVNDNRESLGITADKLASVSQALHDSIPDIKEVLHVAAPTFQNFLNIYQPAQGTLTGALSVNNLRIRSRSYAGQFRPRHAWVPSNPRSYARSTWPQSSRIANTTSSPGAQPPRRHHCPAERGDLQRGLDAS